MNLCKLNTFRADGASPMPATYCINIHEDIRKAYDIAALYGDGGEGLQGSGPAVALREQQPALTAYICPYYAVNQGFIWEDCSTMWC